MSPSVPPASLSCSLQQFVHSVWVFFIRTTNQLSIYPTSCEEKWCNCCLKQDWDVWAVGGNTHLRMMQLIFFKMIMKRFWTNCCLSTCPSSSHPTMSDRHCFTRVTVISLWMQLIELWFFEFHHSYLLSLLISLHLFGINLLALMAVNGFLHEGI